MNRAALRGSVAMDCCCFVIVIAVDCYSSLLLKCCYGLLSFILVAGTVSLEDVALHNGVAWCCYGVLLVAVDCWWLALVGTKQKQPPTTNNQQLLSLPHTPKTATTATKHHQQQHHHQQQKEQQRQMKKRESPAAVDK